MIRNALYLFATSDSLWSLIWQIVLEQIENPFRHV
jgi:hypothetical protein